MKEKSKMFVGLCLMVFLLGAMGVAAAEERPAVSAEDRDRVAEIFARINHRLDALDSLGYRVQRVTRVGTFTYTEKWSMLYDGSGRVRIDYVEPERRVFVFDGKTFTEYMPQERKALKAFLNEEDPVALEMLQAVMQRLSLDGIRVGTTDELLANLVAVEDIPGQPDGLRLTGEGPPYELDVDTERKVLMRFKKMDDAGNTVLSIEASGFREIKPGLWFPTSIRSRYPEDGNLRRTQITIRSIQADMPAHENRFDIKLAPDVEIERME